jgi:subfamily B ATP-binding cassette protein MsbA
LIGLIQHPLTALVFLTYLFFMNYRLTLLVFFMAPIIVGLIRLFGRKVKKHSRLVQDSIARLTAAYQETLLCLKIVQGFCMGAGESRKFRKLAEDVYAKVMAWNRWHLGLGPMMDSTVFLILPAVLIVGKIYFKHSLGELISMIYAFSRVYSPIKNLARVNNELRTLQGATERVFDIMRTTPAIQDRPAAKVLPRQGRSIEFKNVSFAYEPGIPVLRGIDFIVRAGEMAAFVGRTGAGKSTLLDLVPRFYDVSEGSIRIDGTDVRDATIESLRRQIGIVSQEVLLFHDTIANNIRFGYPEKGMDDVIKAAKAAHAHDFIVAQGAGYESVVGDRGALLSGGQRQRIAIARAILADPPILILDEAVSALDVESERLVQEAIEEQMKGRTILVVAHRLSTVRRANRIYVLEAGRIVESGTHGELLAANGRFRELHDMQFRT